MKHRLKSLRLRMLLPVVLITLVIVLLLTTLFSRGYIDMILKREREVNTVGFETVSQSVAPLISASIDNVRKIMADERIAVCIRNRQDSVSEKIHAQISCRDYLRTELARYDGIYGLLFMRTDGSLFGTLPEGNFFQDDPEQNPLPEAIKTRILNAPLGQTVWAGPVSGAQLYGFENSGTPKSIMIAAWKSVHVSYGECYAMMLTDESVFDDLFAVLQDGKSTWHLFAEDLAEIYHTGEDACTDPEQMILESNSGAFLQDAEGRAFCTFSLTMESPRWTVVREVSMEDYEQVIRNVRRTVAVLGAVVLIAGLIVYQLWQRRFMRQFRSLLNGIVRMGEGDLESSTFEPSSIDEFVQMKQEINRTRTALKDQMKTIRRMEREQMELENERKEKERITRELNMAREIQANALPRIFPPFPDRTEFDLYAFMTPAKEVGGDFYDFFLIDSDHLALVIADVSGKGIPAALFMMTSKTQIMNQMMNGRDPAAALEQVNLQLCEGNASKMFVTVWLAVVEISTGRGIACNAGHENPGIRRKGGSFELLEYPHNMFVGVRKKAKYTNRAFELRPGDSLFVYTDGVPEAANEAYELFGEERLAETLNEKPDSGPEELIRHVYETVNRFANQAPQSDDITMLCLRYYGAGRDA